ncbi:V-set and immunoglobulin domain-containing protein 4-like [Empidonax traillii]|uniref:V-set and immunoglobulin domain-containing protein 4-like n=1 Tax=Empidonax traillii TaxID=164674 RepID=UPI000FFD21C0|nr:V-set and immunoglobulin domain-containing protein 4-like [Empidonax traillii]
MGMLLRAAVLLSSLLLCSAFLDLSGPREIKAVWKGSVTLPCTYVPVEDLVQQSLTWSVVHDQSSGTIFRRDGSEDHVLLSEYRARVSVPKDTPGNVSLVILNLEITDRGTYTCQVTWRAGNNSLIAKEITTKVEVVKVAATKPIIRVGELGLTVPAGASTSLTCEASGSPPISYHWFRSIPGGKVPLQSSGAELVWDNLQPSDSGMYFCEAANRVGAGVAQQSDVVELTVTDLPTTTAALWRDVGTPGRHHLITDLPITVTAVTSESGVGYPEKNYTTQDFQRTGLSLHLVILIAVVCGAVVFLIIFLITWIRRPKDAQAYDVKFHNSRAAASSRHESTGHYEEPISFTENNYVMEPLENKSVEEVNKNASECVENRQEYEYEVGDTS